MNNTIQNSVLTEPKVSSNMGWVEFSFICLMSLFFISPSGTNIISWTTVLGLSFIYSFFVVYKYPECYFYIKIIAVVVVISILFLLLTDTATIQQDVSNRGIKILVSKLEQFLCMFLPVLFFYRVSLHGTKLQKFLLLSLCAISISIVIRTTLSYIQVLGYVDRREIWENSQSQNLGAYYFVYLIPLITTLIAFIFVSSKRLLVKVICVAAWLYCFNFLIRSQYTLSLLNCFLGIALLANKYTKSIPAKFIVFILAVVLYYAIPLLLNFIIQGTDSQLYEDRFSELLHFFSTGKAEGDMGGRLDLYFNSVMAFLQSPIIGNRNLNFDGHATFLTIPADIGIIGLLSITYLVRSSYNRTKMVLMPKEKVFFSIFLWQYLFMGLTNPIHASKPIAIGMWFIVPLTLDYVSGFANKNNH